MGKETVTMAEITEAAYRLLSGKIHQSDFDELIRRYDNDTYAQMDHKPRSIDELLVLAELRQNNEINDSTWILGLLGYREHLEDNPNRSWDEIHAIVKDPASFGYPEISFDKLADQSFANLQTAVGLYSLGGLTLHDVAIYLDEQKDLWEDTLPENVVPDSNLDMGNLIDYLMAFDEDKISYGTIMRVVKDFVNPKTKIVEEEKKEEDLTLMVGDKVKVTQEALAEANQKLSELDSYYTVVGGDKVKPNYTLIEETTKEAEETTKPPEETSGPSDEPKDPEDDKNPGDSKPSESKPPSQSGDNSNGSTSGNQPGNSSGSSSTTKPTTTPSSGSTTITGAKDPAFDGKDVGIVDSVGNTAAIPMDSITNAVTETASGRKIEVSGKLNIADLPINSIVNINKELTSTAQGVQDGSSSIADLVRQANTMLRDETLASVEAGTFKGQIDYQQNTTTLTTDEESGINSTTGYTTLPNATTWTSGVPAKGVVNVVIGSKSIKLEDESSASVLRARKYSYDDIVAAANRLTSGDPTMNIAILAQMTREMESSATPDNLQISTRFNEKSLESPMDLNKKMPVNSPSSMYDKNLQGGTTYSSGSSRDGGVAYNPDEERLRMGNIKYHQVYKTDNAFNYIGTTGKQAYNRKVMFDEDTSLIQNKHGYPFKDKERKAESENYLKAHRHHEFDTSGNGTTDFLYLERGLLPQDYYYATNPRVDITKSFNHEQTQDERPDVFNGSFIDNLMQVRAALGIPVHGDLDHAVAMKYFMYNRFRIPDSNLAFNKSVPHIFFTRPDLNLLKGSGNEFTIRDALKHNAEVTMMWRQRPEMFKLLTDRQRCGDKDNFNYLLSNQVVELHTADEEIETQDAGKSWGGYSMPYGGVFTGRNSGKLEITFNETQYGDVTKFLKLWMIYIDNVSRGVWSPSYNLYNTKAALKSGYTYTNGNIYDSRGNKVTDPSLFTTSDGWSEEYMNSHVYTRTIDYAASLYTFRLGPDGDEVIYWTKYYGVFPINGGNSALGSFNGNQDISSALPITATFSYAWKKDMSPMSLLEFNTCANVQSDGDVEWEWVWNPYTQRAGRPFVTKPFIYFDSVKDVSIPGQNEAMLGKKRMRINLRFENKPNETTMGDEILYKSLTI